MDLPVEHYCKVEGMSKEARCSESYSVYCKWFTKSMSWGDFLQLTKLSRGSLL